jgi:hypothetical protein
VARPKWLLFVILVWERLFKKKLDKKGLKKFFGTWMQNVNAC